MGSLISTRSSSPTMSTRSWTAASERCARHAGHCVRWRVGARWADPMPTIPGPRKGMSDEIPDVVPHDTDRRALDLLPCGRPDMRTDAAVTARLPLLVADVRAAVRPAFWPLSACRARLPRLRTQRLAGSEALRLYVRSLCRNHHALHRGARAGVL